MAFVLPERTRERTATAGTGDLALLGTLSPNQRTFANGVGVGNETSYTIVSGDGVGFEEGFGVLTGSTTFQRTTVTRNHLGTTSHISLSGESRIFTMIPGDLGLLFAKYFGGDFSKQILRYSIVTGKWEATLDNGSWKQSCAIATTGPLPANTYANGTSGVGATLTGNSNGQPTIDAVALRLNYRVLVKDEVNPIHNGIYICTREGDSTHTYQLTRAVDYDDPSDLSEGDCVAIGAAGTANGRTIWTMQTGDTGINIGTTTDINWFIVAARPSSNLDLFGSAAGDMLVRQSSNWAALAVGTNGQVLTVVSGLPAWATPAGGGGTTLDNAGIWDTGNSYTAGGVVRDGADFYAAKNNISASPTTAPDLDGHNQINGSGASLTSGITTTTTNDTICAIIATNTTGVTVTSITSSLTFTRRYSNTNGIYHLEIWTAPASAVLTSESIVANLSASSNGVMQVFAVKGANFIIPLDANASIPKYSAGNSSVTGVSTSNLYDMLIYFNYSDNAVGFNDSLFPSGWTFIAGTSFIPAQSTLSYRRVTAAQSSITVTDGNTTSNQAVVFAFTSGNAAPHSDASDWVRLSGFDETAFNTIFGTTRGTIPVKGASVWGAIPAGTSGQILQAGTSGDPGFVNMSAALDAVGTTRGNLLARGATNWVVISPGTTGQVLTMGATDPAFANPTGGGGGAVGLYSPIMGTLPVGADFPTWINQGSAVAADVDTGFTIRLPGSGTDNWRGKYRSPPSTPYKIRALFSWNFLNASGLIAGIGFTDLTKIHILALQFSGGSNPGPLNLNVFKYNSPTSFNGTDYVGSSYNGLGWPIWLHLFDDGTTVTFAASKDGVHDNAVTLFSVAKSSGFLGGSGYSHIFFAGNSVVNFAFNITAMAYGT